MQIKKAGLKVNYTNYYEFTKFRKTMLYVTHPKDQTDKWIDN